MAGIIDRIKTIFRSKSDTKLDTDDRAGLLTTWPDGKDTVAGDMGVSTVMQCVRLISEAVASLPLRKLTRSGKIFVPVTTGRYPYLLGVAPNEDFNAFQFWRTAVQRILCHGNAYIYPQWSMADGDISRLTLISEGCCSYDVTTRTYTISDHLNNINTECSPDEIIHLKYLSIDGHTGVSVLTYARQSIMTAGAGDEETERRFRKGGNLRGFITNDGSAQGYNEYADNQLESLARQLDRNINVDGLSIAAIPGKAQFSPTTMTSADMQFLESRKFTVREICRFFGVHPSFVFDDTSNNYKSAEMANVAFLTNTLNPILVQIETELSHKLLTENESRRSKFEFDRSGLVACDLDSRMKYIRNRIETGLDTINEARVKENKTPVEGGDIPLVSANLRSIGDIQSSSDTTTSDQ